MTVPNADLESRNTVDAGIKKESVSHTQGVLDEEFGQRAVFPLSSDQDFQAFKSSDASRIPLNAVEYLQQVRYEAEIRPVVAAASTKVPAKVSTLSTKRHAHVVPSGRRRLISYEDDPIDQPKVETVETDPEGPKTIYIGSEDWIKKFLEDFVAKKRQLSQLISSSSSSSVMNIEKTTVEWRAFMTDNPPSMSIIVALTPARTIRLLSFFKKWLAASTCVHMNQWLYALLLRLPDIITGEDMAVLRDLCRKALNISHKLEEGVGSAQTKFTVKMVILVVTHIYCQKDLLQKQ